MPLIASDIAGLREQIKDNVMAMNAFRIRPVPNFDIRVIVYQEERERIFAPVIHRNITTGKMELYAELLGHEQKTVVLALEDLLACTNMLLGSHVSTEFLDTELNMPSHGFSNTSSAKETDKQPSAGDRSSTPAKGRIGRLKSFVAKPQDPKPNTGNTEPHAGGGGSQYQSSRHGGDSAGQLKWRNRDKDAER